MPIEVDIWKIQAQPQKLGFSALAPEAKLEDMLKSDLAILSPDWMYLGSQVLTAHGKYIDILAMLRACFVRVAWQKTVPKEQARREKGMYANQNTVTKLRNKFTLEQLAKLFGLA